MANAGAIDTVLWPGAKAIVGDDLANGGSYANKTGYHNSRNNLRRDHPNDYSIQLAIDHLGPGDLGSAQDLTFRSAQGGDYRNIAKYSRRLYQAGVDKDPRTYPLREFQGNIDSDDAVEGWSYYRGHALTTSDKSHLWHIHLSFHRKYINDEAAMRSVLEILNGEELMPSAKEIADELAGNTKFLNAVADAVAKRDGNVANTFTDNAANKFVSIATALSTLGERTQSKP